MASFFYPYKKVGFCVLDKKISPRFQRDFPYKIVYSTVLDSKSADIKAKTNIFLSSTQKCMDIKNLTISMAVEVNIPHLIVSDAAQFSTLP